MAQMRWLCVFSILCTSASIGHVSIPASGLHFLASAQVFSCTRTSDTIHQQKNSRILPRLSLCVSGGAHASSSACTCRECGLEYFPPVKEYSLCNGCADRDRGRAGRSCEEGRARKPPCFVKNF